MTLRTSLAAPQRFLDPFQLTDVAAYDQHAAVCQRLEVELDVLPAGGSSVVAIAARLAHQAHALAKRTIDFGYSAEIAPLDLEADHVVARGARIGDLSRKILEIHALGVDEAQAEVLIE